MKTGEIAMKYLALIGLVVVAVGCSGGDKGGTPDSGTVANNGGTGTTDTGSAPSTGLNPNDSATESEFPVPFYPGSKEDPTAGIPTFGHNGAGHDRSLSANRVTTDSVQQVVDFYKPKITKMLTQTVTADSANLTGSMANGDNVVVTAQKGPQGTAFTIAAETKTK
jgi:hypothetical protein